jgi:hypothetical protein
MACFEICSFFENAKSTVLLFFLYIFNLFIFAQVKLSNEWLFKLFRAKRFFFLIYFYSTFCRFIATLNILRQLLMVGEQNRTDYLFSYTAYHQSWKYNTCTFNPKQMKMAKSVKSNQRHIIYSSCEFMYFNGSVQIQQKSW